jgi:hypothetical protein
LSRAAYYRTPPLPQEKDAEVIDALNGVVERNGRWEFWKCFNRLRLDGQQELAGSRQGGQFLPLLLLGPLFLAGLARVDSRRQQRPHFLSPRPRNYQRNVMVDTRTDSLFLARVPVLQAPPSAIFRGRSPGAALRIARSVRADIGGNSQTGATGCPQCCPFEGAASSERHRTQANKEKTLER